MSLLVGLGLVVAVAAAARSTWSPCGLSMLSTITPLAEAARGRRFWPTASWFVAGGVAGGFALGVAAAGFAQLLQVAELTPGAALAVASLVALATASVDAGVFGAVLPLHRRQVNDRWLSRYRSWVYGAGFGAQVGSGVATYIMTAAVFLVIALAALTADPAAALLPCIAFGLVRGLAILLGARIDSPVRLASFHAAFDSWREPVRIAVTLVQLSVAVAAALAAWGPSRSALGVIVACSVVSGAPVVRHRLGPVASQA